MVFRILKAIFSCVFLSGFGPISDGRGNGPAGSSCKMEG